MIVRKDNLMREKNQKLIEPKDFLYEKGNLIIEELWNYWTYKNNYEKTSLNVMLIHMNMVEQSKNKDNIEYVTSESILSCTCSSKKSYIQIDKDYGVLGVNNKALLTCDIEDHMMNFKVCNSNQNIFNNKYSLEINKNCNENNVESCICSPLLFQEWRQKEAKVIIEKMEETHIAKTSVALMSDAFAVCIKGGLIKVEEVPIEEEYEDEFEKDLRKKGFPDCYIKHIMVLHEKYPKWKFEADITNVDYEKFVDYQITNELKCAETKTYQTNKIFKPEKSGKYYVANKDAITFFSHPYSMLQTDQGKYENALQFLKANQKLPKDYSDKVVDSILSDKPDELRKEVKTYKGQINHVFISCIIVAKNGPIGEEYQGTKVYNMFNIGATTGRTSGMKYAYEHKWFSIKACFNGSIQELQSFLNRNQNTLYSLDWDYHSFEKGTALKQYATLVNDAENKAIAMSKKNGIMFDLDKNFIFSIPVFKNIFTFNNIEGEPFPDPNK